MDSPVKPANDKGIKPANDKGVKPANPSCHAGLDPASSVRHTYDCGCRPESIQSVPHILWIATLNRVQGKLHSG